MSMSPRNLVTLLALWKDAESCINVKSSASGHHFLNVGNNRFCKTSLYWSGFMVSWTTQSLPTLFVLIPDHTNTLTGCFTLSAIQTGWYFSLGRRGTKLLLQAKISKVDSSEKQTRKKILTLNYAILYNGKWTKTTEIR